MGSVDRDSDPIIPFSGLPTKPLIAAVEKLFVNLFTWISLSVIETDEMWLKPRKLHFILTFIIFAPTQTL